MYKRQEPEPAPEAESEAESDPKARVQDDPADEPRDEKPSNEPDIDVDADAEGEDDSQAMPRLTYTEPPAKADEPAQPMRSDANKETTLSDKLPLALVTAIRAPIFSLDTTATTVSPWSLLEHLDPQTSAALMRMDDAPSIDPEQLDFDKLFPELPPYAPPNASDDPASQKRLDESQAQSTRLVHVSRLLDAKPILVSTLDPARYRENGHWVDTSEWAERMPHAPEVSPPYVAGVPPGSLLFSRCLLYTPHLPIQTHACNNCRGRVSRMRLCRRSPSSTTTIGPWWPICSMQHVLSFPQRSARHGTATTDANGSPPPPISGPPVQRLVTANKRTGSTCWI